MDSRVRGYAVGKRRKQEEPPPSFLRRHGKTILGVLAAALLIHDVFGPSGLLAMRRMQREVAQLQLDIARIHAENEKLAEHVQQLKSDPKLIERIAREEMGLARPGEMIFKLSGK